MKVSRKIGNLVKVSRKKGTKDYQKFVEDCERVGEWGVIWGVGGMVCEKKFPAHILQIPYSN